MVFQKGKTARPLLAGKEGGEEISNAGWREFLGTALVPGLLLGIPPLSCVTVQPALQKCKALAEIRSYGNKTLSLSASIWRGPKWCYKLYKSNGRHAFCCKEPISTWDEMTEQKAMLRATARKKWPL